MTEKGLALELTARAFWIVVEGLRQHFECHVAHAARTEWRENLVES